MAETTVTQETPKTGSPKAAPRATRVWERGFGFLQRHSTSLYAFVLGFILFLMVLAPRIFINVPAGHVGVLWLRFLGGTVTSAYFGEGMHLIFPWDEVYVYDARLQNRARIYDTISSNGLGMQVEIAIRYRINRDAVGLLHQLVGPQYDEVLVYPEIGSHARELISRYTPEQLYSETRAFIQAQILERMVTQLGASLSNQSVRGRLVDVEDVLIRSVNLPARVQDAIERKAEQYQAMLEYDFRIARERKERERKKIEAEGIRDFQDTVARTITQEYLRLRGIDATMNLASSPNTKVIIVGGRDGLPLILNTGDEGSRAANPEAAAQSGSAASEAAAMAPAPPNARMMDTAPHNATVPLGRSTRPAAEKPVSRAGTPPPVEREAEGAPATPDGAPAKTESQGNPASQEPSLLDRMKSMVSRSLSEGESAAP
jgi:regulator of protease activity HflC (stomatin/prohibitin superfamily)